VMIMVRREGPRVLHFVTLVPVILAVAFLLRPAAATIDATQSARAVQARLVQLGVKDSTVAVFHVRRDVAYGLNFYRNQPIFYYDPDGPDDMPPKTLPEPPIPLERAPRPSIPLAAHILIIQYSEKLPEKVEQEKKELQDKVHKELGDRTIASIGDFPAQRLEFFVVTAEK